MKSAVGFHALFFWMCVSLSSLLVSPARGVETVCPDNRHEVFRHRTCPLPEDDTTGLRHGTVWTHEPFCLSLTSTARKFCVYTSSAFNLNRGISIIALPESAATLNDAVRDAKNAWNARLHLADAEGDEVDELPYEVRPISGRGLGVVARRPIRQFEVFMSSFPSLVIDDEFFPLNGTPPAESERLFSRALEQLPGSGKDRVVKLATNRGGHIVADVVNTNAFGIDLNGRKTKGLFPEVAVSMGNLFASHVRHSSTTEDKSWLRSKVSFNDTTGAKRSF
jgi:hypothetical protein